MLKETEDKIYFTNSYGQTVTVRKETLKAFALKKRAIECVFPEVAETVDRLFRKQIRGTPGIVNSMAVSLELGVDIDTVNETMEHLEKMGIVQGLPSKTLQVGSTFIVESGGSDRVYNILKEHSPSDRI